ncbi:MAG TPA: MFS transporter [Candidatus Methylomirabilis sp.]|nr:MFS transporter [Candidatus Methylomirabilis sp.]
MARAARLFYGWIVAGVVFLAWAISIGPRQSFSIFLLAFTEDFGWSRSATTAAFSIHMTFYALGGWVLGMLVDRLGPRRVMAWSTVAWVLVLILCSQVQSLWQFYLIYGVVGGVATGGLAYVPINSLLSRWFIRYRGSATGITQAGVPMGTAAFGPLAQFGIVLIGWRMTHVAFGFLVAAISLPLVLCFLRDDPREMGLTPDGTPAAAKNPDGPEEPAARSQAFSGAGLPSSYWSVFGANVLRGMTMYAVLVHQVAYLVDVGYTKMAAATYYSLASILAIPAGLAAGVLSDRLGRQRAYAGIAGLYVVGYVCLLLVRSPSQTFLLYAFVLAIGMATGGGPPVFAAFLTDRLQGSRVGFLLGLQNIGFGLGATFGPFLAGASFDLLGSYSPAFLLMAAAMLVSSAIVSGSARRSTPAPG